MSHQHQGWWRPDQPRTHSILPHGWQIDVLDGMSTPWQSKDSNPLLAGPGPWNAICRAETRPPNIAMEPSAQEEKAPSAAAHRKR